MLTKKVTRSILVCGRVLARILRLGIEYRAHNLPVRTFCGVLGVINTLYQKANAEGKTMKVKLYKHSFLILLLMSSSTWAGDEETSPEAKGLAISIEADGRDAGFVDLRVNMEMVLMNARGSESRRHLRLRTLEVPEDGDKSITIFDSPKDIRGTGLLTFSHKVGPDDQWLNLPALKRVKRISSKNKSGPFVGSEFAFEDLSSQEVEKYTYRYLRDEQCREQSCFVIERDPVDRYSGYTRQVVWIDQEHYRVYKTDYYDRKNSLLKTLTMTGYQIYGDKFWRPDSMLMVNHQTKKSTELIWTNYEFNIGLKSNDFTKNSLKRAR